ncbi:hypothetical protein RhiirA4_549631 [Rhizophagus irregularis]|uniref:Uncharacterized protein n=1 Tax=Rhizophagus irregularis TaxID=588596 RepID=A0A2I1HET7_9GLOM|nr:hypothetical protein RhiirA4_549631 [Rhizophagus irregularis]
MEHLLKIYFAVLTKKIIKDDAELRRGVGLLKDRVKVDDSPDTIIIAELRNENAEIKVKNDELKDKNVEISDLIRKFAEIEAEKSELKARIAGLLKQAVEESKRRDVENAELKARIEELEISKADSSAENVRRDDAIAELKTEVVKLKDNNEESKRQTQDNSPEVFVNIPSSNTGQCDKGRSLERTQAIFPPSCVSDQKPLEDREIDKATQ